MRTCYKPADRLDSISTTQQQVIQRSTQNTLTLGNGGRQQEIEADLEQAGERPRTGMSGETLWAPVLPEEGWRLSIVTWHIMDEFVKIKTSEYPSSCVTKTVVEKFIDERAGEHQEDMG